MEVVTDYFNGAYCINLLSRMDKWDDCVKEFNKHGLCVEWYQGVDGDKLDYDGHLKTGMMGCLMSHVNLITEARDSGLETVLVFEDDVEFEEGLNEKFNEWYKEVPEDWDMLYLGGNHNVRAVEKCNTHLMKCTNTYTTHAYALKHTIYDVLLDRINRKDLDVDVMYADVQRGCNAYCFTPRLAWQRPSVSDIWQQHVDYSFLKDNDGCHLTMK